MKNYKRKSFSAIFLIMSINFHGQQIDNIAKSDTIYLGYTGSWNEDKFIFPAEKDGFIAREYYFLNKDAKVDNGIIFFHFKRMRRNNEIDARTTNKKVISRRFLRENKNKIIEVNFLGKYDICELRDKIINNLKIIYVIDLTELKDRKTNMYEVSPSDICTPGE